jgi:hypothetical protein
MQGVCKTFFHCIVCIFIVLKEKGFDKENKQKKDRLGQEEQEVF